MGDKPIIVGTTYFGSDMIEGESGIGYEERKKRCFELANYALLFGLAPRDSILIHGSIFHTNHSTDYGRIRHAWLYLPDSMVWEPILGHLYLEGEWEHYANARVEKTYTRLQALSATRRHGHYGPWSASKYP